MSTSFPHMWNVMAVEKQESLLFPGSSDFIIHGKTTYNNKMVKVTIKHTDDPTTYYFNEGFFCVYVSENHYISFESVFTSKPPVDFTPVVMYDYMNDNDLPRPILQILYGLFCEL